MSTGSLVFYWKNSAITGDWSVRCPMLNGWYEDCYYILVTIKKHVTIVAGEVCRSETVNLAKI
jgi:hypothetical protein